MDTDDLVTIYYDEFIDLFAIVDLKENCLLDFGIATEVKYAEIFAYKSSGTVKSQEICLSPNQRLADDSLIPQNSPRCLNDPCITPTGPLIKRLLSTSHIYNVYNFFTCIIIVDCDDTISLVD